MFSKNLHLHHVIQDSQFFQLNGFYITEAKYILRSASSSTFWSRLFNTFTGHVQTFFFFLVCGFCTIAKTIIDRKCLNLFFMLGGSPVIQNIKNLLGKPFNHFKPLVKHLQVIHPSITLTLPNPIKPTIVKVFCQLVFD